MISKLSSLYKRLIIHKFHLVTGWHESFKGFVDEISRYTTELEARKIDLAKDKDILRRLLYDKDNSVASRGQSNPGESTIENLLNDLSFTESLRSYLLSPSEDRFYEFVAIWQNVAGKSNPVLWNRVAAARTQDVSTTVDEHKFNQIFYWLQKRELIEKYNGRDTWYSKNLYLISQMKNSLGEEPAFTEENDHFDEYLISMFVWYLYENIGTRFELKKQVIKYGPPGTGKTYLSYQEAKQSFELWQDCFDTNKFYNFEDHYQLIQFHPSFGYEDFIEGMRPKLVEGTAQLILQNGVFKTFCQKAARWEIDLHNLISNEKKITNLTVKELSELREISPKSFSSDYWNYLWELDLERYGDISLEQALPPYFFVIDEINRAELSRVFGELMICLEYRGSNGIGLIQTQYAGLNDEITGILDTPNGYQFFVPHNLYLLGTMNSVDRSVESFDFALRRRFRWKLVSPNTQLVKDHWTKENKNWHQLSEGLEKLNQKICSIELLGEDYQIGHAYFMNLNYPSHLSLKEVKKRVWEDSLHPLLHEYLRGSGNEVQTIELLGKEFGI